MESITVFERRMRIVFGIAFAVLLSTIVVSVFIISKLNDSLDWVAHTQEVIAAINGVRLEFTMTRMSGKNYFLTHQPKYMAMREYSIMEFNKAISRLQMLTFDNPRQQERINTTWRLARTYFAYTGQVIKDVDKGTPLVGKWVEWTDEAENESGVVIHSFQMIYDEEIRLLASRQKNSNSVVYQAYTIMPFMLTVQALITAYIYYGVLHQCKSV